MERESEYGRCATAFYCHHTFREDNLLSLETRGSFWGLGGQHVIKSLRNAMICREKNGNKLYKNEMHK